MSKYTPGPWEQVGNLIRTEFAGEGGWLVAACEHSLPQHEANARLIAAAPDLLEALERMAGAFVPHPRDDTEGWREEHEACELARAAIAKATGAQP